jgi:hypothetical protein
MERMGGPRTPDTKDIWQCTAEVCAHLDDLAEAVEGLRADTAAFREEVLRRMEEERVEPAAAKIQPDPRDPAVDAGYDASGSGGAPKPPAGGRRGDG